MGAHVSNIGELPLTEASKVRSEADVLLLVDMLYVGTEASFLAFKV